MVLLSTCFITGCSHNQKIDKLLQITSCTELAENMKYFQKNCRIDSDCMRVSDPSSFCYSEAVHVSKKDEYETFFKQLNCPLDKADQNDR